MADVSLKEYVEKRICSERDITEKHFQIINSKLEEFRLYYNAQANAIKEATDIVAKSMDDRFAKTNEFREVLSNQQKTFICRDEHTAIINNISKSILELMQSKAKLEGMATQKSVMITLILAVLGFCVSLFALFTKG